ncbi:hypothetical protein DVH05_023901 [Phytophthora capsici]|nr:hypothetical protein DVH05_023901 [Phytophthora capsici]
MQAPHASSPSAPVPTKIRRGRGSDNLLQELRHLVSGGDYGDTTYLLHEIDKRMRGSRDRYIDGGFSLSFAVKSQAAALVFRNACDDVAGFRGEAELPKDDAHLRSLLNTSSVLEFIKAGIQEGWKEQRECPPDKLAVHLPGYYSKLECSTDQAYKFPPEYWLQADNR